MTQEEVFEKINSGNIKDFHEVLTELYKSSKEAITCVKHKDVVSENFVYDKMEHLRMICEQISAVSMSTGTWMKKLNF